MKYCPRCGSSLLSAEKFCPNCGAQQDSGSKAGFPWRLTVIIFLLLFIILGTGYLLYDRHSAGSGRQAGQPEDEREQSEEQLLGTLYDESLVDQWEYPGGVIEESIAYDQSGNLLTIYRDQDTGALQGFWISLPPATENNLTMRQAESIATELAAEVPFFDDRHFKLLESELIDYGPGTESYYYFRWAAVDENSGAILLRRIEICVHPESKKVFYFSAVDGGTVNIPTIPAVTREEAIELALEAAAERFIRPQVDEAILSVTTEYGGQLLIWNIYIDEASDPDGIAYFFCVLINALTGEIVDLVV